jgi:D-alanyl-D-alanine carboxypeptidase
MIPLPGSQGSSPVMVASNEPVQPMPYPTFRSLEPVQALPDAAVVEAAITSLPEEETVEVAVLEAPTAPVEETVEVAAIEEMPLPAIEPEAVAEEPLEVAAIAPIPAEPMNIGIQPALAAANQLGEETAIAPVPAYPPDDIIGAWISQTLNLGAAPAELGQTRASAPLVPPVGIGDEGEPIDLMSSGSITPPTDITALPTTVVAQPVPVLPPPAGAWVVQVGAAGSEQDAAALLIDAATAVSTLAVFQPFIERLEQDGQLVYRARFAGFGDRNDATTICSQLKQANKSCLAMQS